MKYLAIFLVLSGSLPAGTLTFKEIKILQEKEGGKKTRNKDKNTHNMRSGQALKKELDATSKKLEAYRYIDSLRANTPIIDDGFFIGEGQLIGAKIEIGVLATNVAKMISVVSFRGVDLPKGSKIRCSVYAKYKRVCGKCNRLVINGVGQTIDADLLNRDGTQCVIGELIDGKDRYISGILLSEAASGAISLAQSSVPTVGGNLVKVSAKNALIQAGLNTGEAVTDLMKKEYESSESLVLLKSGSDVIISFNTGVNL